MGRLTPSERMLALSMKDDLDRVPVVSSAGAHAAYVCGISLQEYCLQPEKALRAQMWTQKLYRCDGRYSYNIPERGGWDFGGKLKFPKLPRYAMPAFVKRAVTNEKEVETLKVPDFSKAPGGSRVMRFARLLREKGLPVTISGGSPLGLAGSIAGPDLLLRWILKKPALVHRLLRLATDYLLQAADLFIKEFGPEACSVFSAYPWECRAMVSPKVFEKFSLPYVVEIHNNLIKKGIKRWTIHLCGDHTDNLDLWLKEIPLVSRTIFTISHEVSISATAKKLGAEYIIGGNVSTVLLRSGTPEQVFEESKRIIEEMKYHPGGFILMPSCALPLTTPPANLFAMIHAAKTFGRYDLLPA